MACRAGTCCPRAGPPRPAPGRLEPTACAGRTTEPPPAAGCPVCREGGVPAAVIAERATGDPLLRQRRSEVHNPCSYDRRLAPLGRTLGGVVERNDLAARTQLQNHVIFRNVGYDESAIGSPRCIVWIFGAFVPPPDGSMIMALRSEPAMMTPLRIGLRSSGGASSGVETSNGSSSLRDSANRSGRK